MARAATADAEYDDMECRYRQTVESLSTRYDELQDERNALTNKLAASPEASPADEQAEALRASLEQLSAQVKESQQHLHTA
jgi:seryl-tRNA synthetase